MLHLVLTNFSMTCHNQFITYQLIQLALLGLMIGKKRKRGEGEILWSPLLGDFLQFLYFLPFNFTNGNVSIKLDSQCWKRKKIFDINELEEKEKGYFLEMSSFLFL